MQWDRNFIGKLQNMVYKGHCLFLYFSVIFQNVLLLKSITLGFLVKMVIVRQ